MSTLKSSRARWAPTARRLGAVVLLASANAYAALPVAPAGAGVPAGDPMGALKYWLGVGAAILLLGMCLFAFTSAGAGVLAKFNEWRNGREELGTFLTVAVVAFAVIVMVILLATQASTIFPSTAGALN